LLQPYGKQPRQRQCEKTRTPPEENRTSCAREEKQEASEVIARLRVRRSKGVSAYGTDRGPDIFSANKNAVASRDGAAHSFTCHRIDRERIVVNALFDLDGSDRFAVISRFVNVSRNTNTILLKQQSASCFRITPDERQEKLGRKVPRPSIFKTRRPMTINSSAMAKRVQPVRVML